MGWASKRDQRCRAKVRPAPTDRPGSYYPGNPLDPIARLGEEINELRRIIEELQAAPFHGSNLVMLDDDGLVRARIGPLVAFGGTVDVAETIGHPDGRRFVGPPKTRAGRRRVPVPRVVVAELERHFAAMGARAHDALVFPGDRGGYARGEHFRITIWHPAVARAGLTPLRPHDLRHTAVALRIAAGASPKEIAARAGHTSVVTVLDR